MDIHHRRTHTDAGDLCFETALIATGVVTHIGRRATHIKTDKLCMVGQLSGLDHTDHTTRRAG